MKLLDNKAKILAFLTGCTLAIASTTMLFSLTEDPRRGFDFHYADIMIPVLLYTAFMFKKLERPQLWVVGLSGILVASILWSEDPKLTSYSAVKFSAILITFSCIRTTLKENATQLLLPLGLLMVPSVAVAAYHQLDHHASWGLHGNPNLAGGTAAVLFIATTGLAPRVAPLTMLLLSGARGAILALFLFVFLDPTKRRFFHALLVGIVPAVILFVLVTRGINPTGRFDLWLTTSNIILDHPWLGTGFDTRTQYEATNAHNIFLMFLA
ncbi:hypothetical protein LCGC14_0864700, partial [marine sediment metagenome]